MKPDEEEVISRASGAPEIIRLIIQDDFSGLDNLIKRWTREKARCDTLWRGRDVRDSAGWEPLHWAVYLRRFECAKLLFKAGQKTLCAPALAEVVKSNYKFPGHIDVNMKTRDGTTAAELLMYTPLIDPFIDSKSSTSKKAMADLLPKTRKGLNPRFFYELGMSFSNL